MPPSWCKGSPKLLEEGHADPSSGSSAPRAGLSSGQTALDLFCRKCLFPIKSYAIYSCLPGSGCTVSVWRSCDLKEPSVSAGAACWHAGEVVGAGEEGFSSHMLLLPMPPCCLDTSKERGGKANKSPLPLPWELPWSQTDRFSLQMETAREELFFPPCIRNPLVVAVPFNSSSCRAFCRCSRLHLWGPRGQT